VLVERPRLLVLLEYPQPRAGSFRHEELDGFVMERAGRTASPLARSDEEASQPASGDDDEPDPEEVPLRDHRRRLAAPELGDPMGPHLFVRERVPLGRKDVPVGGENALAMNRVEEVRVGRSAASEGERAHGWRLSRT
jgi:hypothetical protein